ncbi:hypothetical protein [Evansella tamaricis]|uniref:Uncharacterized protein n=1 Tax=Evansella tamaricis TaxID=2069301 RepID=A0ABS6JDH8_9BACI|nr:hypothetical protein [Evansella tamaricis]MBU9711450.1 hypothetical protein [Evansella tamaricis]
MSCNCQKPKGQQPMIHQQFANQMPHGVMPQEGHGHPMSPTNNTMYGNHYGHHQHHQYQHPSLMHPMHGPVNPGFAPPNYQGTMPHQGINGHPGHPGHMNYVPAGPTGMPPAPGAPAPGAMMPNVHGQEPSISQGHYMHSSQGHPMNQQGYPVQPLPYGQESQVNEMTPQGESSYPTYGTPEIQQTGYMPMDDGDFD